MEAEEIRPTGQPFTGERSAWNWLGRFLLNKCNRYGTVEKGLDGRRLVAHDLAVSLDVVSRAPSAAERVRVKSERKDVRGESESLSDWLRALGDLRARLQV